MSPTETKTIEQLAFDGPISLSTTAAIALLLIVVFSWALYREKPILGWKTTVGFAVLRFLAIGTVLWMLLAPSNVVLQRSSTRRAVAIMTDVSASMRTVDPLGTADEPRWAIATGASALPSGESASTNSRDRATVAVDRAIAALGIARRELVAAIQAIAQYRSEAAVIKHTSAAQAAITRAKASLESVHGLTESAPMTDPPLTSIEQLTETASTMLSAPEFESFAELCSTLARGKTPSETGWRESLTDLEQRLIAVGNSTQDLSRAWSRVESSTVPQHDSARQMSFSRSPRIERVATFLENLKRSTLDPLDAAIDLRWSRFDKTSTRLVFPESPKASLMDVDAGDTEPGRSALATNLSSALEQLRQMEQQQPVAAAFVFSDVAHNDSGTMMNDEELSTGGPSIAEQKNFRAPIEVAASLTDTPVYVIPIGNPRRLRDIDLVAVEAPPVAMRNDDVVIEVHLEAHQSEGERVVVQLIEDAKVIDFREVEIDSGFVSRTIRFERRVSEIGEQSFQIAAEPIAGEMTDENNYEIVDINVTRSDIKVLLADEMPRWEFRYLAQLFRRDSKVDCDEILFHPRMIATGKREQSQTFPVTLDEWDQYDVVILGDLPTEHLPLVAQESLVRYLRERGGTLIMIAGERAMPHAYVDHPLEEAVPVRPVDASQSSRSPDSEGDIEYEFRVTEEGRSHVALMIGETQQATRSAWDFVNRFSPLQEVSRWRIPKSTARNLIAAVPRQSPTDESLSEQSTFLCWQPVGRGRVVYLSGPDTYRLRFLRGDQFHFRFWGQLLRWAIASDLAGGSEFVRIRAHKTRYEPGEDVRLEVRLFDAQGMPVIDAEGLTLQLTSATENRSVPMTKDATLPGLYISDIRAPKPGVYRAVPTGSVIDALPQSQSTKSPGVSFTVHADLPMELLDTRCNQSLAAQIAELTGGQVLPPTAVAEVLALTDLEPVVNETVQRKPLWTQWRYLWLVLGCLQMEWIVRKWRGLS